MSRMMQVVLVAGAWVLGAGAWAQEAGHGKGARGSQDGRMVEVNGFMAPTDEKALLDRLRGFNAQVMQLARMANTNAQHPEVKAYAQAMLDAHTQAEEQLGAYASKKSMKLSDKPKPMNRMEKDALEAHEATVRKLQGLMGAPFDSVYMANQVAAHDEALGLVLAAQKAFPQGELATLLLRQAQHLPQHRQQAYRVLGQLNPAGAMGVGGAGSAKPQGDGGR